MKKWEQVGGGGERRKEAGGGGVREATIGRVELTHHNLTGRHPLEAVVNEWEGPSHEGEKDSGEQRDRRGTKRRGKAQRGELGGGNKTPSKGLAPKG